MNEKENADNQSVDEQCTGHEQSKLVEFSPKSDVLLTDGGETKHTELNNLTPSVRTFIKSDRDNKCEKCGAEETEELQLEIHHIKPQSEGGTHDPDNLKLLCMDCHDDVHGRRRRTERSPEPLPPHTKPNDTDKQVIEVIERLGPVETKEVAELTDYTYEHMRRTLWKLAGEKLILRTVDNKWDTTESESEGISGIPDTTSSARKAGRDEVIRQMAAHGLSRSEISDITDLSSSTVDLAIHRARSRRLINEQTEKIDVPTIASQLMSIVRMLDHSEQHYESI